MSGFDLVPVDGGGDPVHLPQGDTVLGRGPFLGVSDKRVSRHHGLLQNLNGRLSLKPTHTNPCFVQSSLTDDPRPLQRDVWHRLHHGDLFSLLPGQLIYKVEAVGGEERTPRDSPMFEEEAGLPVSPEPDVDSPPGVGRDQKKTLAPPSNDDEDDRLKQEDQSNVAPSRPRRVLPAWMLANVATPKTPSSTFKVQSSVKRRKKPAAPSAVTQATPTTSTSPEGVGLSEEEEEEEEEKRPRKKRRRISDEEENPQTGTDVSPEDVTVGELRSEVSEGKANVSTPASEMKKPDKTLKNKPASDSASKPAVRTPCPFGKDCYRKNPLHFQECSHPGDADYKEEEEEEEEDEDRPECPYGTDCYRKNPLHRKEYKHTKKPARSTRTAATKDEDGEDSEDADSFINDDSEDAGEDSDYVPPDSDDSGKEDIKRLQKEAIVFLKRKK